MEILDVYTKKEYTCKKCNGQIYYAKLKAPDGTMVTKDGQQPNGKYGKESNTLSAAVDVNNKEKFHECYKSFAEKAYAEALTKVGSPKPEVNNLRMPTFHNGVVQSTTGEFEDIANDAYQRLFILASKFCGEGANVREKHITTMGLMHDYFQWITRPNK